RVRLVRDGLPRGGPPLRAPLAEQHVAPDRGRRHLRLERSDELRPHRLGANRLARLRDHPRGIGWGQRRLPRELLCRRRERLRRRPQLPAALELAPPDELGAPLVEIGNPLRLEPTTRHAKRGARAGTPAESFLCRPPALFDQPRRWLPPR